MLFESFLKEFKYEPTPCQLNFFRTAADFLMEQDEDILVVNGYAGTGKTSAVSALINAIVKKRFACTLMAPTGRAAKVLSQFSGFNASTIHKVIYRQSSVGEDGVGKFKLAPNKAKNTLFVVDEASLISTDTSSGASVFGSGDLLGDLVSFVRSGKACKLIMIGDSAQLPPIGLDKSPALDPEYMAFWSIYKIVTLSTVVRQQLESGILHNATLLRENLNSGRLDLEVEGREDIKKIKGDELIEALNYAFETYGQDQTIVICRSNKKAIRYNLGIRSMVEFKEEKLLKGDKLMVVKNCYQFLKEDSEMGYIANGDVAVLQKISSFEERYGLHFAKAVLTFPDYNDERVSAKVILDTLESESASLNDEQREALFLGVSEDYADINNKRKRYEMIREDEYYNALQLKYAQAVTCHKSQGGQWDCVFIDCPFWEDFLSEDDKKWMYTALTRATKQVYLVNFKDKYFND